MANQLSKIYIGRGVEYEGIDFIIQRTNGNVSYRSVERFQVSVTNI